MQVMRRARHTGEMERFDSSLVIAESGRHFQPL
jgi:hypothetical protein